MLSKSIANPACAQYDLDGSFTDIMELAFYNAVLTAMSVHGTSYTYVNQLASSDKNPAVRQDWFKVSKTISFSIKTPTNCCSALVVLQIS